MIEPNGFLYGVDQDGDAIEWCRNRFSQYENKFQLLHCRFAELGERISPDSCDGVLMDLGVSSPQLDRGERGFSFMRDGPLDMRMDQNRNLTAEDLIRDMRLDQLLTILRQYGEEPKALRLARAIVKQRQITPFTSTGQLADFISQTIPSRNRKIHAATKAFQALRIAVNEELETLENGLKICFGLLKKGGRLGVITFHSLEARIVKRFGVENSRDYDFPGSEDIPELRQPKVPVLKRITRKPLFPGDKEIEDNPRSRSAQLRIFEKI
jgi:16S rRNA (cytosine1402-N4)-methyltransferase